MLHPWSLYVSFSPQVRSQSVNTHLGNVAQEFIYDKDEHIFVTKCNSIGVRDAW